MSRARLGKKRRRDRLIAKRRANGICMRCGKKSDQPEKWLCSDCLIWTHEYLKRRRPALKRGRTRSKWRTVASSRPINAEALEAELLAVTKQRRTRISVELEEAERER